MILTDPMTMPTARGRAGKRRLAASSAHRVRRWHDVGTSQGSQMAFAGQNAVPRSGHGVSDTAPHRGTTARCMHNGNLG